MSPHPRRVCDSYLENQTTCPDCMPWEEEAHFWERCYNGKHYDPADCPTWHDWCNCGGEMVDTISFLKEERARLIKKLENIEKLSIKVLSSGSLLDEEAKDLIWKINFHSK